MSHSVVLRQDSRGVVVLGCQVKQNQKEDATWMSWCQIADEAMSECQLCKDDIPGRRRRWPG